MWGGKEQWREEDWQIKTAECSQAAFIECSLCATLFWALGITLRDQELSQGGDHVLFVPQPTSQQVEAHRGQFAE